MAEINKDEEIVYLPILGKNDGSTIVVKTYTIYTPPTTRFYKVANAAMQVLGFLTLLAWFGLLLTLIAVSFSVLNNLNSVNVIRNQHIVSAETVDAAPVEVGTSNS